MYVYIYIILVQCINFTYIINVYIYISMYIHMYVHIRLGNRESQTKQPSCKPLADFTKFLPGGSDGKRATFLQKKKETVDCMCFFCGRGDEGKESQLHIISKHISTISSL